MRHLYRGKSEVDGQMVYGSLLITEIGGKKMYCIIPYAPFVKYMNGLISKKYNVWNENGATNNSYIIQVISSTINQCTGLTDINDRKIFEGDIVRSQGYLFVVKYGKCGGVPNAGTYVYIGFYLDGYDQITKENMRHGLRNDICYYLDSDGLEVVGNIYDDKALILEGE